MRRRRKADCVAARIGRTAVNVCVVRRSVARIGHRWRRWHAKATSLLPVGLVRKVPGSTRARRRRRIIETRRTGQKRRRSAAKSAVGRGLKRAHVVISPLAPNEEHHNDNHDEQHHNAGHNGNRNHKRRQRIAAQFTQPVDAVDAAVTSTTVAWASWRAKNTSTLTKNTLKS
jgi:hypothetical protein